MHTVRWIVQLPLLAVSLGSCAFASYAPYKSCNQPVDVVFVFDNKACISLARDVIYHYKSLMMPETKLRFGVAYCTKTTVEHTGPEAGLSHLLMTTENLQHSTETVAGGGGGGVGGRVGAEGIGDLSHLPDNLGLRAENTPYPVFEITDIRSSADSCLKTVGVMFDSHGIDKSAKMAVLVATHKSWADPRHIDEAEALKGPSYNTTLAVITAGIESIDALSVLESMATSPRKFMSVDSINDLHDISNKFSQGSCRLSDLDLSTPSFPVSTMKTPAEPPKTCKRISDNTYEVRTNMGPLGYVLERRQCELDTLFDVRTCTCAIHTIA